MTRITGTVYAFNKSSKGRWYVAILAGLSQKVIRMPTDEDDWVVGEPVTVTITRGAIDPAVMIGGWV